VVQALADAVVVVSVARIVRHLEIVDEDHGLGPPSLDDLELTLEREVFLPVSIEIEQHR